MVAFVIAAIAHRLLYARSKADFFDVLRLRLNDTLCKLSNFGTCYNKSVIF